MFELRRIGIVKRASALLLDAILLAVLTTGFMFIISLICNYSHQEELANEYFNEWEEYRSDYIPSVSAFYGFEYSDGENGEYTIKKADGSDGTLDDVLQMLDKSEGNDPETAEAYSVYKDLMERVPPSKVNHQYRLVYSLLFMLTSIGLLLAYIILEFIVPLIFKNGQTIGKKVFAIALVKPDCVKISTLSLFARTLLGKYAIETMFPVLLVFMFFFGGFGLFAVILFAAITLLNLILFFATKNKTPIHDLLAGTVAVDMKLQMIFETEEELVAKKSLATTDGGKTNGNENNKK